MLLPLSLKPGMRAEDFCVGDSNHHAWTWVRAWPQWPTPGLVIYGPSGCGKTHLGKVFQEQTGAFWLTPDVLEAETPAGLLGRACLFVVDDADAFVRASHAGSPEGSHTGSHTGARDGGLFLLQLYNLLKEHPTPGAMLLLASEPPARWRGLLPDLASRLNTFSAIAIEAPDDELMTRVLMKLFHDCQLAVQDPVCVYLLRHMERSFAQARLVVARLNELSLVEKRPVTVDLCRRLLGMRGELSPF